MFKSTQPPLLNQNHQREGLLYILIKTSDVIVKYNQGEEAPTYLLALDNEFMLYLKGNKETRKQGKWKSKMTVLECNLFGGRDLCLFCSLKYSECLEWCLRRG